MFLVGKLSLVLPGPGAALHWTRGDKDELVTFSPAPGAVLVAGFAR